RPRHLEVTEVLDTPIVPRSPARSRSQIEEDDAHTLLRGLGLLAGAARHVFQPVAERTAERAGRLLEAVAVARVHLGRLGRVLAVAPLGLEDEHDGRLRHAELFGGLLVDLAD